MTKEFISSRLFLYLFLLFFIQCKGQTAKHADSKFKLWVSFLVNDSTHEVITYYLTQDSIKVKQGAGWDISENDEIFFSSKFDRQQKNDLIQITSTISNNTFKSFYYNPCIIYGTGLEFSLNKENQITRTTLSNYYLESLDPLVNFINKTVPQIFTILYDKEKLQDDLKKCPETQ